MNHILEVLRVELEGALGGLDAAQTQLRPGMDANRWSVHQIAGHLRLTYVVTVEAMNARIGKGTPTKAKPSAAQYFAQLALIGMGYFPRGRKAPERVIEPVAEMAPGSMLISRTTEALLAMDRRIAAAEVIFGLKRRVISHMVLGPLSIRQWQRFHLIHGRHHIKQIHAIREEHGI